MAHPDYTPKEGNRGKVAALLRFYKAIGMKEVYVPIPLKDAFREGRCTEVPLDGARSLDDLKRLWGECTRCRLHKSRTNLVFGEGNPQAKLVFVGEGPGQDEDLQGRPFVGKAGMLLTDIIEKGLKIRRPEVYITNIVKCRPPGNREPEPDEVRACIPLLWRQLEIIKPQAVCALGKVAAQSLLDSTESITTLRGKLRQSKGFTVLPTYHPAYLLRNESKKRETWEDLKVLMKTFSTLYKAWP
jgi:uracil-DNA glycosylase family 4